MFVCLLDFAYGFAFASSRKSIMQIVGAVGQFESNFFDWFGFQTFMDLQFPNGQLTYVAGEGLTTSAFLPLFGGLLQAQGQYPGETRFSFSCKVT